MTIGETPVSNNPVASRRIAGFEVSAISLGAMNVSHAYGAPTSNEHGTRLLNEALDVGYTMIDTAALYGFGANETLVGNAIGHRRSEYLLASKCGLHGEDGQRVMTNDPLLLKKSCEDSLQRLQTDVIDLFYLHRWDKVTPIEDSVGMLGKLVEEGKVRAVGLSEVSANTLKKAHAVHPIAAVQSEYSLWTREPEIAILDACRELGTTFIAFSPLARGFLCGKLRDIGTLQEKDLRRKMPRFYPENYAKNLQLLDAFAGLAQDIGCSMGQLALAWLLHTDSNIVPIPGTTNLNHLRENLAAADLEIDSTAVAKANEMINRHNIVGERYVATTQAEIDTEQFS
ncbi:MAG: aldo/keto reductase [Woeseiaceae bacterium]